MRPPTVAIKRGDFRRHRATTSGETSNDAAMLALPSQTARENTVKIHFYSKTEPSHGNMSAPFVNTGT